MRRTRLKEGKNDADVDMTPMLDIVFILLIFFIVTTSFVREESLLVNKPKKGANKPNNDPTMLVRVDENGRITFNGKDVDIERLEARIENFLAKHQTNSVILIPAYDAKYDKVVAVIDKVKLFDHLTVSIGKS
ncbi:ExbD/TolR family protein [Thalassotalea fusca]